jgi:hypothetical protein
MNCNHHRGFRKWVRQRGGSKEAPRNESPNCAQTRLLGEDCGQWSRHERSRRWRCHFVSSPIELVQGFALHLQLHLRKSLGMIGIGVRPGVLGAVAAGQ